MQRMIQEWSEDKQVKQATDTIQNLEWMALKFAFINS